MRVLVIGRTGQIATELLPRLAGRGACGCWRWSRPNST